MKIPILRLEYSEEEISFVKARIEAVMKSGFLTMGKMVNRLDPLFPKICHLYYVEATSNIL